MIISSFEFAYLLRGSLELECRDLSSGDLDRCLADEDEELVRCRLELLFRGLDSDFLLGVQGWSEDGADFSGLGEFLCFLSEDDSEGCLLEDEEDEDDAFFFSDDDILESPCKL